MQVDMPDESDSASDFLRGVHLKTDATDDSVPAMQTVRAQSRHSR